MPQIFICLCRVFDIADEIDLDKAKSLLTTYNTDQYRLRKYNREMIFHTPPLLVGLGEMDYLYNEALPIRVSFSGKIWNYGALSLIIKFEVSQTIREDELVRAIETLENDVELEQMIKDKVISVSEAIGPALRKPNIWKEIEDYTVVQIIGARGESIPQKWGQDNFVKILEGEMEVKLSQQTKESFLPWIFNYSTDDMMIMDWNRAIIAGEWQDVDDQTSILELALCQLLELRFYDGVIDQKLNSLYKSIQAQQESVFVNNYSTFSKEAALRYIEFSEVIDMVGNSLKVIGDSYYAKLYRAAIERFRINDWKKNVEEKLDNLASISTLFATEVNEKRNQMMELTIIFLIAIEVVPLIYRIIESFFI